MTDTLNPHADQANMDLATEVAIFAERCADLANGTLCNAETAPKFQALKAEAPKLKKRIEDTHDVEKRPHLEAGRAVDAKYLPLLPKLKGAVDVLQGVLTQFLQAEEKRIAAERAEAARLAREEEERAAKLAAEAEAAEDPFEAFDKVEESRAVEATASSLTRQSLTPVKAKVANAEGGRSGGLRSFGWLVEVTDPAALVAHYAHRSEFLELATQMAKREATGAKGQCTIPGAKLTEDRRAA